MTSNKTPNGKHGAATAETLRANNLALVLRQVLAGGGTATRATIAAETRLTRATVSRLVDELIAAGIFGELSPTEGQRGRPATRLWPEPGRVLALGLEVNVNYLAGRVLDLGGEVITEEAIPGKWNTRRPSDTMNELAKLGLKLLKTCAKHTTRTSAESYDLPLYLGAGVALPGLISQDKLSFAPNLGWRDLPLGELLTPLSDLMPRVVMNEGDLAAYAYAHPQPGVPSGPRSFIYVSGAVGIGGGIIVDHEPLSSTHGWAGEIGHICTNPNGPKCKCGSTGCLEAYLGLWALLHHAGLDASATTKDLLAAAASGSEQAQIALRDGGVALGRALAAAVNTIDIPLVILGGNVAEIGPEIIEYAKPEIKTRALQATWAMPEIRVAANSFTLAATGAASRVIQDLVDDPISWTRFLR